MNEFVKKLKQQKVLPLFTPNDAEFAKKVIEICIKNDIYLVELTLRHPSALQVAEVLAHWIASEQLPVELGAGTVIDAQTASRLINAGIKFCVSPCIIAEVMQEALRNHLPVIPGCFTPTEMWQAYQMGASALKVFPAQLVEPATIKALLAPMPFLPLMPSGGVALQASDIQAWINAGCIAVCMGSALISEQALKHKNITSIAENLTTLKQILYEIS